MSSAQIRVATVWTASRRSMALRREQAHRRCLLFVSHKVADYGPGSEGFTWRRSALTGRRPRSPHLTISRLVPEPQQRRRMNTSQTLCCRRLLSDHAHAHTLDSAAETRLAILAQFRKIAVRSWMTLSVPFGRAPNQE